MLASLSMSAEGSPVRWVPPGGDPGPVSGQPGPPEAGAGLWPAGQAWPPWPPPPPVPPSPPGPLASWLASPAAAPLHAAAAAVTAAGWAAAAAVLAGTVVSGRPAAGAAAAAPVSAFVLAVLDFVAVGSLAWRGRAQARPPGAARAYRRAARQARRAVGGGHGVMRAARGLLRALRRPAFPSLPRPARLALEAMLWATMLATAAIIGRAVARGFPAPDPATAGGQQLIAWTWMMHLVTWCRIACRGLNRSRAAASILTPDTWAASPWHRRNCRRAAPRH